MRQLSPEDFSDYIEQEEVNYLYNPRENLAFRCYDKDGEGFFFCKCEGGQEKQIRHDDKYFNEAWLFAMVMTPEEYKQF